MSHLEKEEEQYFPLIKVVSVPAKERLLWWQLFFSVQCKGPIKRSPRPGYANDVGPSGLYLNQLEDYKKG